MPEEQSKEKTTEIDIENLFRQIRKTDKNLRDATDRGDAAAVENLRKKKEQLIGLWYMAMEAQKKPDPEQQRYVQREAQYEGCLEAIMAYTIVLKSYLTEGEELMQRSTVRHAAEDPKERVAEQIEAKNLFTMGLRMAEAITSAYNTLTRNLNEPDVTTRQQDSAGVLQEEQQDAKDLELGEPEQKNNEVKEQ